MKTYIYTLFLRHPQTKETQHGTIEFDSDDYIDAKELFDKISKVETLASGYTLIAMQIVNVVDSEVTNPKG